MRGLCFVEIEIFIKQYSMGILFVISTAGRNLGLKRLCHNLYLGLDRKKGLHERRRELIIRANGLAQEPFIFLKLIIQASFLFIRGGIRIVPSTQIPPYCRNDKESLKAFL